MYKCRASGGCETNPQDSMPSRLQPSTLQVHTLRDEFYDRSSRQHEKAEKEVDKILASLHVQNPLGGLLHE